jgi:predicted transcriptional regulator
MDESARSASLTEVLTEKKKATGATSVIQQENSETLAAIDRGLADVAAGRVHRRRSYAQYSDIEIDD